MYDKTETSHIIGTRACALKDLLIKYHNNNT